MKKLKLKQGNYGFKLQFTITEADDTPKDLSDLIAYLKIWKGDSLQKIACSIADTANGVVECIVSSGLFDETGIYLAEIELQGANYVEDTETFVIEVVESK